MISPDLKYNDIFTKLGGVEGSIWYTALNMGSSEDTRQWLDIRDVKNINISELDVSNYSEGTSIVRDIMDLGEGSKLRLKFWLANIIVDGVQRTGLTYKAVIVKNGVETNNTPRRYSADYIHPNNYNTDHYGLCPLAAVKTYGLKFVLFTDYRQVPYGSGAITGITQASSVTGMLFAPVTTDEVPGTIRSWANIVRGARFNTNNQWEADLPTFLFYPSLCPESYSSYSGTGGTAIVFEYDDMTQFKSDFGLTSDPWEIGTPDDPTPPVQDDDPSTPGGGGGNYDDSSDPIDFPSLPTGGALSSGAIKAFAVSPAIMTAVFNELWNTNIFDISTFQRLVDNPIDCLISFHCIPIAPSVGSVASIKFGNFDTGTTAPVITNQYLTIDCGSLNIKEFWGSALDYSPYTKCELYMPFIGIKELKIEDVMNATIHIKYNVDIFTGDVLCNVKCGQSVLYKFTGNFKQDIPVSGRTSDFMLKGIQGALAMAGGISMGTAIGGPVGAGIFGSATASAASTVASSKIITTRSGSLSGSVGLLDDFVPYLIFHRPVQSLASKFSSFKGYPSNITKTLSSLKGYTEVEYINLQNIPNATSAEMDEIKSLLRAGVLL